MGKRKEKLARNMRHVTEVLFWGGEPEIKAERTTLESRRQDTGRV